MDTTKPADESGEHDPYLDDDLDDLFADALDHEDLQLSPSVTAPPIASPADTAPEPPAPSATPAPVRNEPVAPIPPARDEPVAPTPPAVTETSAATDAPTTAGSLSASGTTETPGTIERPDATKPVEPAPSAADVGDTPAAPLAADAPRSAAAAELFSTPPQAPGATPTGDDGWDAEDSLLSWRLIAVIVAVLILVGFGAYKIFGGKTADTATKAGADVDISATFAVATPDGLPQTDTGQDWEITAGGAWATQDGHAYVTKANKDGAGKTFALVDLKSSSGGVSADVSKIAPGWGLVFRYKNAYNYWMLVASPKFGSYNLMKIDEGKSTAMGSSGLAKQEPGTSVGVTFVGGTVTILVNNTPMFTVKGAGAKPDGTKVGLVLADATGVDAQWGPFTAKKLAANATPPTAPPGGGGKTSTTKAGGGGAAKTTTTASGEAGTPSEGGDGATTTVVKKGT